jgi:hypothetical protein
VLAYLKAVLIHWTGRMNEENRGSTSGLELKLICVQDVCFFFTSRYFRSVCRAAAKSDPNPLSFRVEQRCRHRPQFRRCNICDYC